MTALVKYEAALHALAECKAVDEVKEWADKAAAMQAYGRMAKDKTLEVDAAEIRIRAERRLGEMLAAQKAGPGLAKPGRKSVVADDRIPKLAEAGISKDLSSRAQKLAAVPAAEFEAEVGEWRERVSAEGARVSAKLEAAGEREIAKRAKKDPAQSVEPSDDDGPSDAELEDARRAAEDDAERVRLLLESDEPLRAMTEKCAQLQALVRTLTSRINGLMNESAEATRLAKMWRKKYEKLEKEAAGA